MTNSYKLIWSDESLNKLNGIIQYLNNRWTEKEIKRFIQLLDHQLNLIQSNPYIFPVSSQSNELRKAVLSKQTTIYYSVVEFEVRLITLFDNRQNPNKLIKK